MIERRPVEIVNSSFERAENGETASFLKHLICLPPDREPPVRTFDINQEGKPIRT
jgi:hypothetical protein